MVLSTQVESVDVHASVVRPVVSKGHDELDANLCGSFDHLVKRADINGGSAVGKPLEDHISSAGTLTSVLR